MKYTDEQLSFISDRGHNVLVSAAAGSGKTAVIVERVIRLITEEGYSVSELLVVTFTRAAAAEMRDRIRDAISDRLRSGELTYEVREHLNKQLMLIYTADITTIDSFCLDVVRSHFNICGIDPSFRVADEGELKLISEEVMEALLDRCYEEGSEAFLRLVEDMSSGRDDSAVAEHIRSLYSFAVARPDPVSYLKGIAAQYRIGEPGELDGSPLISELRMIVRERLLLAGRLLKRAIEVSEEADGPYFYTELLEKELQQTERLSGIYGYEELREAFLGAVFDRLPSKKDEEVDPDKREYAKGLRDKAKKIVKEELLSRYMDRSTEDILYELAGCLPYAEELSRLAIAYMEDYAAAKEDRGVVDFTDLEHMALQILKDQETRESFRDRYREIIIDEYQDSNRVQEEIFSAIGNGHDYVTVGDVKQSIYSFRDACPELFVSKSAEYESGDNEASRLITLSRNFRSSRAVTGSVNSLFSLIMSERCGGVSYDESQRLNYGDIYKSGGEGWNTEYLRIEKDPAGTEDGAVTEARAIARRIRELVGNGPGDGLDIEDRSGGGVRRCGYGDIVILLRSLKGASDGFSEVFAEEGIPLIFDSRSGYLLSYEIREIMNFLSIIDNPRQDISLGGVMLGFFGGFSASEAALIRACSGGELYDSLVTAADGGVSGELRDKCKEFLDTLERYRKKAFYTPIHELIHDITADFKYDHYVRAMNDGMRRLGNLRLLMQRASDYENTSFHGLFKFLRYIESMKKYEIDFGEASGNESADAVRIMSIHHSKGLEFPVVFVSGMRKGMNQSDSHAPLLMDDELGLGHDLIIREKNLRIRTLIRRVIAAKKDLSTISEEMRILYVAMTRAENKLILTSLFDEKTKAKADPAQAACLADFVEAGLQADDGADEYFEISDIPFEKDGGAPAQEDIPHSGEADRLNGIKKVIGLKGSVDQEAVDRLLQGLNREYKYKSSLNVPQKVSVSYIKHEEMEEKGVSIASDPRGDRVIPTAGALRGTAVHTAFENLPLGLSHDEGAVSDFLDGLVSAKKLSQEERGYIRTSDIMDFLDSDIASRMREASERHELYREQPFIISVPASRIDASYPDDERVMVQGIIDAFFIEGDMVVVIDYKTDSVSDERILIDRYQAQLDYYEGALRQLLSAKRSQKIIYSVSLAKEIEL